jgi:hypothetical protein
MPDAIDTPEYWRKRAEETRTLASTISDPNTKRVIAGSYEMLAKDAEERAKLAEKQPGQE